MIEINLEDIRQARLMLEAENQLGEDASNWFIVEDEAELADLLHARKAFYDGRGVVRKLSTNKPIYILLPDEPIWDVPPIEYFEYGEDNE